MKSLILAAASSIALIGCAATNGGTPVENGAYTNARLERLYAVIVQPEGLRVRARSNGCTNERSFNVTAEPAGANSYLVTFERANEDSCTVPDASMASLFYSREDIGVPAEATIVVANPIGRG
ncbi:MAG: hypothetical protein PVI23_00375 [Maricaulaceae bacterium]|jgi:hypothetical protein